LVLAEKLFGLDISSFPKLAEIEEENKRLDFFYDIYKSFKAQVNEWSMMPWSKIDAESMAKGAEEFFKKVKRYNDMPEYNEHPTFQKLYTTIKQLKDSIPLI